MGTLNGKCGKPATPEKTNFENTGIYGACQPGKNAREGIARSTLAGIPAKRRVCHADEGSI
ncbi:MAG: hypothetical protein AVDCRST_MAG56-4667 [uncultured Cytophagales bacterium]|uniref:Uncharacterized protein n=1 Tax=uncultured Cytophagales bacterium TaxID=158755 RepID=A0A6J4JZB3_9SPHI|nr:MAG: hypothetical protein AVDCRST_MAG56-4667 [uncultured Cytophagales bacterium]